MQQARLAHAWLGHQIDDAELRTCLIQSAFQHLQFAFTSDKRAEAPAYRSLEPRGSMANCIEPIGLLRLGFALDLMVASEVASTMPCTNRCVVSLSKTVSGSASDCNRAAKFTVSPRTVTSGILARLDLTDDC